MNDEANTHYAAMVDQMIEGNQYIHGITGTNGQICMLLFVQSYINYFCMKSINEASSFNYTPDKSWGVGYKSWFADSSDGISTSSKSLSLENINTWIGIFSENMVFECSIYLFS